MLLMSTSFAFAFIGDDIPKNKHKRRQCADISAHSSCSSDDYNQTSFDDIRHTACDNSKQTALSAKKREKGSIRLTEG